MKIACFRQGALCWWAICALSISVQLVNAQKLVQYSSEVRFQLDLHVSDQASGHICRLAGRRMWPRGGLLKTPTYE